jgi:hypothetical protein
MSNMSYCRFQNTLLVLYDCQEHIHEDDLSESEQRAKKRMIQACKEIADEFSEEE